MGKHFGKTKYNNPKTITRAALLGALALAIILSLLTGCSTTKKTKKCCDKEHVITEWDGDREIRWYTCSDKTAKR